MKELNYRNLKKKYNSSTQKSESVITDNVTRAQREDNDKSIAILKDTLTEIVQLQKKIIPTVEESVISENDRENYISNMDDFLMGTFEDEEEKILKVEISPMYKCSKLLEELVKQNYIASIYRFGSDKKFVSNIEHDVPDCISTGSVHDINAETVWCMQYSCCFIVFRDVWCYLLRNYRR